MFDLATMLQDMGNIFETFVGAEPNPTDQAIVKALPTAVITAKAVQATTTSPTPPATEDLVKMGLVAGGVVAANVFTGGAAGAVVNGLQALPAIEQLVGDMFEMAEAAKTVQAGNTGIAQT